MKHLAVLMVVTIALLSIIALVESRSSKPRPSNPIKCEIVGGWIFCDGEPVTQIICTGKKGKHE